MTPLTEAEVAELERLEKAAIEGPWTPVDDSDQFLFHADGIIVGRVYDLDDYPCSDADEAEQITEEMDASLGLICAGRSALPQLLAAWRESQAKSAEIARLRGALEKIADAPACGPDGQLYYEVASEDGQVGCMHVDPLGWIGSAATTARAALAKEGE